MEPLFVATPRTAPTRHRGRAQNFPTKTPILAGMADYSARVFRQSWIRWFLKRQKCRLQANAHFPACGGFNAAEGGGSGRSAAQECRRRGEADIFVGPSERRRARVFANSPKSATVRPRYLIETANVVGFSEVAEATGQGQHAVAETRTIKLAGNPSHRRGGENQTRAERAEETWVRTAARRPRWSLGLADLRETGAPGWPDAGLGRREARSGQSGCFSRPRSATSA
jgi:hypothetical protein